MSAQPTAEEISNRYGGKRSGEEYIMRCPCHEDKKASLSVANGKNGKLLIYCHAGCKYADVAKALDLPQGQAEQGQARDGKQIVAVYQYRDLNGEILSETVRYKLPDGSKDFRQRKDANTWTLKGVKQVPYRHPELDAAIKAGKTICHPEGEKDADNLARLGFEATTNQGGANKPRTIDTIAPCLKGADVVVFPDNAPQPVSREHAEYVAAAYARAGAKRVRIAKVPEPHKDISDYIAAGAKAEDIQQLIGNAPEWAEGTKQATTDSPTSTVETPKPADKAPQHLRLIHARDLHLMPPLTYLIDGLLPAGGFSVLYGASGSGKSFLALAYSLQIAQHGDVIYIAAEGSPGYADRVAAYCNHHHVNEGNLWFIPDAVNLLNDKNILELFALITPLKPLLLVIDTLARCIVGADENSSRDVGIFIDACNRIQRETGTAVLVIHHTGKAGNSERGSSALRGAADMMLELTLEDQLIILSCSKSKDSAPFQARYLRMVEVPARAGRTSCVLMPADKVKDIPGAALSDNHRKALDVLTWEIFSEKGATATRLWQDGDIPKGSINRVITSLLRNGYISRLGKGASFCITNAGRSALQKPEKTASSTRSESGSTGGKTRQTTYELAQSQSAANQETASPPHTRSVGNAVDGEAKSAIPDQEIKSILERYGVPCGQEISVQRLHSAFVIAQQQGDDAEFMAALDHDTCTKLEAYANDEEEAYINNTPVSVTIKRQADLNDQHAQAIREVTA